MDNLTHTLIGAALGQAGLKRRTGLAMPALILAANLPDVDAPCAVFGLESLAMRRGLSHGPLALVLLPLLLAAALWGFDRWQMRRGKRPEGRLPVDFKWLLGLCYLGTLTHPLFDWFNNYGIRLLEPFSSQWFYGDTLFIIDPWIIAMLGAGVWFSLKRERAGWVDWFKPSRVALAAMSAYVTMNLAFSSWSEAVGEYYAGHPYLVVANAVPVAFWKRDVLIWGDRVWGPADHYQMTCHMIFGCERELKNGEWWLKPTNMSDPRIAEWAKSNPAAQAFLFWSRMPIAELHPDHIVLRDQRFMDPRTARQFSVTLRKPDTASYPE